MDQVQALLLGIGVGSLVVAIALSVVVTHRGSGVVNFSAAALAMYAAYVNDGLRRDGQLFLPPLPNPLAPVEGLAHQLGAGGVALPDWPTAISFGRPLPFAPSLAVTLVVMAVMGLLIHLLVFRPLRSAPPLAKVVASVGLLIVLQAVVTLRFGATARPIPPMLAKGAITLPGDLRVPQDQLVLALIVLLVAGLLALLFARTRFGLATRAAAENERGAVILGFSPDVLAGANWVLSTLVASLLGVLVATVNGSIDPITITLLIVPALGAALLGRFRAFGVTVLAGFSIAMAQNLIQFWSTQTWFPKAGTGALPGAKETLPFVVIVAALFLRERSLPDRGTPGADRLPFAPRPSHIPSWVGGAMLFGLGALLFLAPTWRLALTNSLIGVVLCLSLVVLTGLVGQISLTQMALAGVAGFTVAKLAHDHGVGFPLGPLLGVGAAVAVGLVAAVPALRVRGVNLAVVTLAAAVAIENVVFENPAWSGGQSGAVVPPPRLGFLAFGPNDDGALQLIGYHGDGKLPNPWFGVFCLVVAIVLALLVSNVRRSATGRRMLAVRANERAAAAAGVSVSGTKVLAFGLAAFIAGVGGTLSGYRSGSVTPLAFGATASILLLAFAYLGGIASISGAVLGGCLVSGGVAFTALDQWFGIGDEYTLLVGGIGLLVTAVLSPEGMAGAARRMRAQLGTVVSVRRGAAHAAQPPIGLDDPVSLTATPRSLAESLR